MRKSSSIEMNALSHYFYCISNITMSNEHINYNGEIDESEKDIHKPKIVITENVQNVQCSNFAIVAARDGFRFYRSYCSNFNRN